MRKIIFFLFPFLLSASDIKTSPLVIPHEFRPYVEVFKRMCNDDTFLIGDAAELLEPLAEPFKTLKFDYPAYLRQFLPYVQDVYLEHEKNYHNVFKLSCSIEPLNDYFLNIMNERKTFIIESFNNHTLQNNDNLIPFLDAQKQRDLLFIEFEQMINDYIKINFKAWSALESYYGGMSYVFESYVTAMLEPEDRKKEICAIKKRRSDFLKEFPPLIQQKVEKDTGEFLEEVKNLYEKLGRKRPSFRRGLTV